VRTIILPKLCQQQNVSIGSFATGPLVQSKRFIGSRFPCQTGGLFITRLSVTTVTEQLYKSVIKKVLHVVSLKTTNLCNRNHPSLLKKTTKEDLTTLTYAVYAKDRRKKHLCFIRFSWHQCCESNRKIAAASSFGSVAIAGSIL
jgi:hypothetical protein